MWFEKSRPESFKAEYHIYIYIIRKVYVAKCRAREIALKESTTVDSPLKNSYISFKEHCFWFINPINRRNRVQRWLKNHSFSIIFSHFQRSRHDPRIGRNNRNSRRALNLAIFFTKRRRKVTTGGTTARKRRSGASLYTTLARFVCLRKSCFRRVGGRRWWVVGWQRRTRGPSSSRRDEKRSGGRGETEK